MSYKIIGIGDTGDRDYKALKDLIVKIDRIKTVSSFEDKEYQRIITNLMNKNMWNHDTKNIARSFQRLKNQYRG